MVDALRKYTRKLARLRQGVTPYGRAPHKPILLLAVLRGIDEGWITDNRIELSPELVATFKSLWIKLVQSAHSPLIAQPFFYMRGERFWFHVPNPGYENWVKITRNCNSIGVLHKAVAYARFDPELYALAISPTHRAMLKTMLLETYFPNANIQDADASIYWDDVEHKILSESSASYQAEIQSLQDSLDNDRFEEELFVRSGVFKRQVPLIYNYTCCISRLHVETTINASLVDACHIVPFSESRDDTISNGLALCPTLHRAFDRGLVAIDPDTYRVIIPFIVRFCYIHRLGSVC